MEVAGDGDVGTTRSRIKSLAPMVSVRIVSFFMPKSTSSFSSDLRLLETFWQESPERTVLANGLTLLVQRDTSARGFGASVGEDWKHS